jgi:trehalose 6-phosphate phosphatase
MTLPAGGVPRLFKDWSKIAERIRAHHRVVVFLDFDGTLVAIAPRPGMVNLTPAARRILRRLARHPNVTLVVVSGRRRAELLHFIGIPGIRYFGLYGWESSAKSSLPPRVRRELHRARVRLQRHFLRAYPSVWIENKRNTFSVHLLGTPARLQPQIRSELRAHLKSFRKSLRCAENLRDMEVLPRSMPGKGIAVRRFLAQPEFRNAFPFYFGDDLSDEPGFAAVRRGVSVHVGEGSHTRAQYVLRSPALVVVALRKLESAVSKKS